MLGYTAISDVESRLLIVYYIYIFFNVLPGWGEVGDGCIKVYFKSVQCNHSIMVN